MGAYRAVWHKIAVLLMISIFVFVSACSSKNAGGGDTAQQPEQGQTTYKMKTDPVTLTFYNAGNINSYYEEYIAKHIRAKLPHISINYIRQAGDVTLTNTIAQGTLPDIIYMVSPNINAYKELGVLGELDSLIKSHHIDMSRLLDGLEESIRVYGDRGELLYMPWGLSNWALYYNKDLFDRFAVPYPKDGMTWDDVYPLARQLTRNENGVNYRGFDFDPGYPIRANQLSLPFVDPKTHKAVVNTDGWKRLFETLGQVYRIPGNEPGNVSDFHKGTVAMIAGATQFPQIIQRINAKEQVNVDIVSFPTFPEKPKTSMQTVTAGFAIPAQSKYRDQAMDIIELMLSDEVQKEGSEILRLPVIKNKEVYQTMGQAYPELKGMNVGALTYNNNAVTKSVTKYDDIAQSVLISKFNQYKKGTADVNTILREAEEEINKKIEEKKKME
jgi:multiple sugar transport system substrate-binding protein